MRQLLPLKIIHTLYRTRFVHFFVVGASGVAINLGLTAFFTELVFGREQYFTAYLIGLSANLLYNFILHTFVTFKTRGNHTLRLVLFVAYSLGLAYVQAQTVRFLVSLVGVDWYLLVIGSVILAFSVLTFFLFKFGLFKEGKSGGSSPEEFAV